MHTLHYLVRRIGYDDAQRVGDHYTALDEGTQGRRLLRDTPMEY